MIPNIEKILFTTDLSKSSRHAFSYAISIADRYRASIRLLHVMEDVSHTTDVLLKDFLGEERWREINDSREQEARQILIGKKREGAMIRDALKEYCEEMKSDLADIRFTVEEIVIAKGNVVDEILSEAQGKRCDLIVMGYHTRGKLEEAVLGSTTRRVLRRSKTPVMLVQLVEDGERT
jgi:nucleotide-binding universal stress UspA family protein